MNKKYLGLLVLGVWAVAVAASTGTLIPSGSGTYNAWTPSSGATHYTLVDETSCNGVTDYVSTNVVGNRDSYAVSLASIPNGSTITAVTIAPCASRNTNKTSVLNVFYRLNGTNSADQGSYSLTGTTPVQLASTTYSGLSVTKTSGTTLEAGAILTSGTGGARLSNLMTSVTYTLNFSIFASAGANGSISPVGTTTLAQGSNQTYTITPNAGYYISSLVVDGVSVATSTSYTFTNVQAAHTITVGFTALTNYTIFASAGANGSISPVGTTTLAQGSNQTYTITPNSGYFISSLVVDGAPVTATSSYTFTNLLASHTIAAGFTVSPPIAPTNLVTAATTTPFTSISLIWRDNASNENGFEIERGTDGINFGLIATTTQNFGIFGSYNDGTGTTGVTYYYRVRTFSTLGGTSAYTNTSSSTMP